MSRAASSRRAGFSLVEMLLAVFILGIGVISIASLFPAGIALQRQATDATVGPIVAKNALAVIRSKLSQQDFGSFEDFGVSPQYLAPGIGGAFKPSNGTQVPQLVGDWCWMRPNFMFTGANAGTIDVFGADLTRQRLGISNGAPAETFPASELFNGMPTPVTTLFGMPYNPAKYPLFTYSPPNANALDPLTQRLLAPEVTFTQAERSYPQGSASFGSGVISTSTPLYYWDCMFRKQGGRIQVAVFVYRVTAPGGVPRAYSVQRLDPNTVGNAPAGTTEPLPFTPPMPSVYFAPAPGTANSWPSRTNPLQPDDTIPGTNPGSLFGNGKSWDDWMAPGQVWVDNHGNRHEVLRGRLVAGTAVSAFPNQGPVKTTRRIPINSRSPIYGASPTVPNDNGPQSYHAYIGAIWYVPLTDAAGNVITPVYVAVEEL